MIDSLDNAACPRFRCVICGLLCLRADVSVGSFLYLNQMYLQIVKPAYFRDSHFDFLDLSLSAHFSERKSLIRSHIYLRLLLFQIPIQDPVGSGSKRSNTKLSPYIICKLPQLSQHSQHSQPTILKVTTVHSHHITHKNPGPESPILHLLSHKTYTLMLQISRYCRGYKSNKKNCSMPIPKDKQVPFCRFHEWQAPGHSDSLALKVSRVFRLL